MGIQIITTDAGEELVVMSRRDYDAMLARGGDEDAEDRMTLLIAAEARGEAALPAPVSAAMLAGDSLLRALRKWRGMTQAAVAAQAEINQGYLSELEAGTKTGAAETLRRLARVYDAPEGWLV